MKVTTFRFVLGAAVLMTMSGAALSEETNASKIATAATAGNCPATQALATDGLRWNTSTNARHANVSRVRYTAAHAMPPSRTITFASLATTCPVGAGNGATSLD